MSTPEFQTTVNWDELALVRPISPTSSPLTAGASEAHGMEGGPFGTKLILTDAQQIVIDRLGIALEGAVIVDGSIPADSALIKDLLLKLGEAKELNIFAIENSGAIGIQIGTASATEAPSGIIPEGGILVLSEGFGKLLGFDIGTASATEAPSGIIPDRGTLELPDGYGTILLAGPDGAWQAIHLQAGAFQGGEASITAVEGVVDGREGYGGYLSGVESEIIPVGFNGMEMFVL